MFQYFYYAVNGRIESCLLKFYFISFTAVQNERDRISCRRTSMEEHTVGNGLSAASLLNAEMLSRQVGAALEVSLEHLR